MIEFTMTRVTLGVCGLLLLAAAVIPVTDIYDDRETDGFQDQCDSITEMLNAFWLSDTDEIILDMSIILPSADSTLCFEGQLVKMTAGDSEYRSISVHSISSDGIYDSDDLIRLVKTDSGIGAVGL